MEKFAVDLDKVLDDFEFNEDCAEQIASVANPIANATLNIDKLTTNPSTTKESSVDSRRIIHSYEIPSFEKQENNTTVIKENKSPLDKSIIIPSNVNYHKDDSTLKSTDSVNNFHTDTRDKKVIGKQTVYLQNSESTSATILNNTSQVLLVKKQNGNSNQQIQNKYDQKLNQPNIKPTLSNVFNSLNEYINAPTISLDYEGDTSDKQETKPSKEYKSFDKETGTSKNNKDIVDYNLAKSMTNNGKTSIKNLEAYNNACTAKDVSSAYQDIMESKKQPDKYNTESTEQFHSLGDMYKQTYHDSNVLETLESCTNVEKKENKCVDTESNKNAVYPNEDTNFSSEDNIEPEELKYESNQCKTAEENKEFCITKPLDTESANINSNKTFSNNISQIQSSTEPLTTSSSKSTNLLQSKQKPVGFNNMDDLSEEELNKYLETLETEEKLKEEILPDTSSPESYKNSSENIENNSLLQEMRNKNEYKSTVNDNTELYQTSKLEMSTKISDCSTVEQIQEAIIDKNYNDSLETEDRERSNNLNRLIVIHNKEEIENKKDNTVNEETNYVVDINCTNDTVATNQNKGETEICKSRVENTPSNMKQESSQSKKSNGIQDGERNNNQISELQMHSNISNNTKDKNFKLLGNKSLNDSLNICMDTNTKNTSTRGESDSIHSENNEEENKPVRPQTLDITSTLTMNEHRSSGNAGSSNDASGQQSQVGNADNNRAGSIERSDNTAVECIKILGKQPPFWIPDSDAPSCMLCDIKFTVLKRRHHCRACGKVLCNKCCNMKYRLEYQGNIDSRVCTPCYSLLMKAENGRSANNWSSNYANTSEINSPQGRSPNPNNPMEYCSTIPPLQQVAGGLQPPPAVMVPVGVLKREGSTKQRPEGSKSVMFSDGIRPGCDLTELDTSWDLKPPYRKGTNKRLPALDSPVASSSSKRQNLPTLDSETNSYIPHDPDALPPTVTIHKGQISYHNVTDQDLLYKTLKNECEPPVMFAINRNLYVYVKITNLNCCVNRTCWNVTSKGLACVGQDEIILLIETLPDETQIPKDLFLYINHIYVEAMRGNTMTELSVSIHQGGNLLGSREHAGFLFIRQTLQCLQKIVLPPAPFLIGLLIHRWETPWAKVFPLRLLLRLGAEYRYYPCPLVSVRFRDALYFEIGHTVMKVLADFRNFGYTLPSVRGLTIHLKSRTTDVMFPKNRYDQVIKGLNNSNDHVLAFASNFSISADSHLVCIQTNTGDESSYQTQAINIQNKPRTVTGASFIVINGALKSSMGLSAKSSIVEDGLMVEIMPEKMEALKVALKNMQDFSIGCGRQGAAEPDETVNIKWVDNDVQFNLGVKSPIDGRLMDGIPSIRVHNATDYKGTTRFIRWTEVFIIKSDDHPNGVHDPMDINKLSESIARATCTALVKLLDLLATAGLTKIGVRTTIHPDSVGYEAGSEGAKLPPIYMNSLDNELIQILHKAAQSSQETHTVLELIFYILDD